MTNFKEFLKVNNERIRRAAFKNTLINSSGAVVIPKDDVWRRETEWDTMYEELKR